MIELHFLEYLLTNIETFISEEADLFWKDKLDELDSLLLKFESIESKDGRMELKLRVDTNANTEEEKLFKEFQLFSLVNKKINISIDETNLDENYFTIIDSDFFEELIDIDIPPYFDEKSKYFSLALELYFNFFKYLIRKKFEKIDNSESAIFYYKKIFQLITNLSFQFREIEKSYKDKESLFTENSNSYLFYVTRIYLRRYFIETQFRFQSFIPNEELLSENQINTKLFGKTEDAQFLKIREIAHIYPFLNKLGKIKNNLVELRAQLLKFTLLISEIEQEGDLTHQFLEVRNKYNKAISLLEKTILLNLLADKEFTLTTDLDENNNNLEDRIFEFLNNTISNSNLPNFASILKEKINVELLNHFKELSKKGLLSYSIFISNYLESIIKKPEKFDFTLDEFLKKIFIICANHQSLNQINRLIKDENKYNSFLKYLIQGGISSYGLTVSDQDLFGQTPNFSSVKSTQGGMGELDFVIRKSDASIVTIIEAFILSGLDTNKITTHLKKIFFYDPIGLPFLIFLIYVEDDNIDDSKFIHTYNSYKKYLTETEFPENHSFKYPIIEKPIEKSTGYANQKLIITKHKRMDTIIEIAHLVYKIW
ncbi:hypothetical protein LPTSP4_36540 [Leptospira ryugenii]|uniref:Uncharacterized protein n=1 Tax=Leptospira ryugenii TaxID=1917863 RepID=A0A2P2E5H0_9LEPT|nr:hypothetical protein [Leptospira ryugenii]GBF52116.1 hypothetical protein LPTSP4_36540 [Leptospira ryugenii]